MQRRTYPFAFVILSPGSKIGHTPRKNPSAPMGAAATSRINAYRGWCRTPVLHQPFAAKKYDTTIYRKLQVFFQQIVKYFLKNSAFCRNSLSRPFPAFSLWGYHLLPWYIIHVPAQKARVVSRIFCLAWCIFIYKGQSRGNLVANPFIRLCTENHSSGRFASTPPLKGRHHRPKLRIGSPSRGAVTEGD